MRKDVAFSSCRKYRYALWRVWEDNNNLCMVVGLNPSTADETNDDPTIRKCIGYAQSWGYSGLVMTNIFGWRDTSPDEMKKQDEPIGLSNDRWLIDLAEEAGLILCAWGNHGTHMGRDKKVVEMLDMHDLKCLKENKNGTPQHPLYLKKTLTPIPYPVEAQS